MANQHAEGTHPPLCVSPAVDSEAGARRSLSGVGQSDDTAKTAQAQAQSQAPPQDSSQDAPALLSEDGEPATEPSTEPVKRKRGRPRKYAPGECPTATEWKEIHAINRASKIDEAGELNLKELEIARRISVGQSIESIRKELRVGTSTIRAVRESKVGAQKIREYVARRDASIVEGIPNKLENLATKAVEFYEAVFNGTVEVSNGQKVQIAADILDRAGYPRVTSTENKSVSANLSAEDIKKLSERGKTLVKSVDLRELTSRLHNNVGKAVDAVIDAKFRDVSAKENRSDGQKAPAPALVGALNGSNGTESRKS